MYRRGYQPRPIGGFQAFRRELREVVMNAWRPRKHFLLACVGVAGAMSWAFEALAHQGLMQCAFGHGHDGAGLVMFSQCSLRLLRVVMAMTWLAR